MYLMLIYLKEMGFVIEFFILGLVENIFLIGIVDCLEWDLFIKILFIIDLKIYVLFFI